MHFPLSFKFEARQIAFQQETISERNMRGLGRSWEAYGRIKKYSFSIVTSRSLVSCSVFDSVFSLINAIQSSYFLLDSSLLQISSGENLY
jgi:hypothetical protein